MRSGRFVLALFAVLQVGLGSYFYHSWFQRNLETPLGAPVQWGDLRVAIGAVFCANLCFLMAVVMYFSLAMNHVQDLRAQVKRLEAEVGRLQEAADRQVRNARRLEDELDRLRGSLAYPQELP